MGKRLGLLVLAAAVTVPVALASAPAAQAPNSITIAAAPTTVVYGGSTTLSGTIAPPQAGQKVTVHAQACGQAQFGRLADVDTVANGAWTLAAKPTLNTQYRARVRNVTSTPVSVGVRPRLQLAKVGSRKYRVRVLAAQSFAGKIVTFQRYRAATDRWVRVRRSTLRQVGTEAPPTVVSGITFRARVRGKPRVRVVLPQGQAGACYLPGRSNAIRS